MTRLSSYLVLAMSGLLFANNAFAANNAGPGGGDGDSPGGGGGGGGDEHHSAVYFVPSHYPTIQSAIDAASDGEEVRVSAGTYTGSGASVIDTKGKALLIKAVGSINEAIILDGEGSRRVIVCDSGEGSDTLIQGFMIINGFADVGGGIYCEDSSPTFVNCFIKDNYASGSGGGMANLEGGSPTLTNCTFKNNSTGTNTLCHGGGLYNYDLSSQNTNGGSPTLTNCTFANNSAYSGGGVWTKYGGPMDLTDCTFENNSATGAYGRGGGFCNRQWSQPSLKGCTFTGNSATGTYGYGGGMYTRWGFREMDNCTFTNNSASNGGGIYMYLDDPDADVYFAVTNSTICGNTPNQVSHPDIDGVFVDGGGNHISADCNIPTSGGNSPDINGDGNVNGEDMAHLLGAWGTNDLDADIDGDGLVGGADLSILLGAWN